MKNLQTHDKQLILRFITRFMQRSPIFIIALSNNRSNSMTKDKISISQETLTRLRKENQEYESWQRGETEEKPSWLEKPIGDRKIIDEYCKLASKAVYDGVIFKGNKIIEILPWDED